MRDSCLFIWCFRGFYLVIYKPRYVSASLLGSPTASCSHLMKSLQESFLIPDRTPVSPAGTPDSFLYVAVFDAMKKGFVPLFFIQWGFSFEQSMSLMVRCVRMSCRRDERGMYTVLFHVLCQHCLAGHMNLYGWRTLCIFRGCTTSGPTTFSYEHHLCDTCGDIRCNLWLCHCLIRLFATSMSLCF